MWLLRHNILHYCLGVLLCEMGGNEMKCRCFKPLFCTMKAELGWGQPGLMRIFLRNLPSPPPQSSIDTSTLDSVAVQRSTARLWRPVWNGRRIIPIRFHQMETEETEEINMIAYRTWKCFGTRTTVILPCTLTLSAYLQFDNMWYNSI